MSKSHKLKKFGRRILKVLKATFSLIYVLLTTTIPIIVFAICYYKKESYAIAIAIAVISLIIMDIVCSISEDSINKMESLFTKIKRKRQIKKDKKNEKKSEDIRKLQKLLDSINYEDEVMQLQKDCRMFESQESIAQLPKDIKKEVEKICRKIQEILEILEKDSSKYREIRHTFRVYFPEFKRMTNQYIDNITEDNLDEEIKENYKILIEKFSFHLDKIKSNINSIDKLTSNSEMKSLVKIMETERNKGEE